MVQQQLNFDPPRTADDKKRHGIQREAVRTLLGNGCWWTLAELLSVLRANGVDAAEQSVSARVRDMRKQQHGGHTVERKRVSSSPTVFAYRMSN